MLELENVYKKFDEKTILSNINLIVKPGTTHALIGSSGSGKTTLLRITLGLIPFDRGWVKINGQARLSFTQGEWAEKIGYVPQEGGLFPHLSAAENITLVATVRKWKLAQISERLDEMSSIMNLDAHLLERYPHELSGGQRQRVALMRAAFMDPPLMILDEPMGALDPIVRRDLQQELKSIFHRLNKTVLIVTHDLTEAAFLAEQITLLHQGKVLQTGSFQDLLHHPADPFVSLFISAHRGIPES